MSYPALGFPPPDGDRPPDVVDYPEDDPPPPEPPRGSGARTWWVLTAVAAVTALAVGVLLVGTAERRSAPQDTSTTAAAPTTSRRALTPTPLSPPPMSGSRPCDRPAPGPQTPAGWQPVSSNVDLAYDVPANWTVGECGVRLGWEKKCAGGLFGACPVQILRAGAQLTSDACPDRWRGVSGLDASDNARDLDRTVREKAELVADIYTGDDGHRPQVTLSDPRALIVDGTPALQIIATVTGMRADRCQAPRALHSVVATTVPGQNGAVVFVVSIDQGYPGAPAASLLDELVGTLRHT
jgi:hypothetical protein